MSGSPYSGVVASVVGALRRRLAVAGGDYPQLYPVVVLGGSTVVTITAVLQRYPFDQPWWVGAAVVCALTTLVLDLTVAKSPLCAVPVMLSTVCFLMVPVPTDVAPLQLALVTAIAAAMYALRTGLIVAAVSSAVIVVFGLADTLESPAVYLLAVACGWLIGYMVLIQKCLADNQARELRARADRAAGEERRRIAREIHDVIAHSLSITMLNVTGARRALEQDDDRSEALEALTDAERQGRQAMTEIRNIVHVLGGGDSPTAPVPGATDLTALIDDYRKARIEIDFRLDGDLDAVSAPVGAALYRIVQESLANVVKHSVTQRASVAVSVDDDVVVCVRNPCPENRRPAPDGTGVKGMMQRAELLGGQLEAGCSDGTWSVRGTMPTIATSHQGVAS